MTDMHPYEIAEALRGVTFHSQKRAREVGLKRILEKKTGISFSTFFSDRKAAYQLKMAVHDWIEVACREYWADFPFEETKLTKREVLRDATAHIYWELVCQEYGEDRAIAAYNKVLGDASIRDEFRAEGDATSSRDFSYILDSVQDR